MNNSNLFTAAHKLTKLFIAEYGKVLDYRTFFSYALKALHMQANQAKRYSFAQTEMQRKRMPEFFKKTPMEIWSKQKNNKFFWNTQVSCIQKSLPSMIAKDKKRIEEANEYYKKGNGVTMC